MEAVMEGKILDGEITKKANVGDSRAVKVKNNISNIIRKYGKQYVIRSIKKSDELSFSVKDRIVVPARTKEAFPRKAVSATNNFVKALTGSHKTEYELKGESNTVEVPVVEQVADTPSFEPFDQSFVETNDFPMPVSTDDLTQNVTVNTMEQEADTALETEGLLPIGIDEVLNHKGPFSEVVNEYNSVGEVVDSNVNLATETDNKDEKDTNITPVEEPMLTTDKIITNIVDIVDASRENESRAVKLSAENKKLREQLDNEKNRANGVSEQLILLQKKNAEFEGIVSSLQSKIDEEASKRAKAEHDLEVQVEEVKKRSAADLSAIKTKYENSFQSALEQINRVINFNTRHVQVDSEEPLQKVA